MGKYSKKIKRKFKQESRQKIGEEQLPESFLDDLAKIREQKDNGRYDEGLQACINTFEKYGVKTDTAYEVAELYYLSGDYEHAAIWCENTLNINNRKVDVYLLLAKIALLKDQSDNVLALLQKVVMMTDGAVSKYQEDMEELLNLVLIDYDETEVQSRYSLLWKTLKNIENQPSTNLRYHDETSELQEEEHIDEAIPEDDVTTGNMEEIQLAIMREPISLMQKITRCHEQAYEFYKIGDLLNALDVLKLAMSIDNTHHVTLKNMGFILNKLGRIEEAKAYFSKVEDVDLMILDMLD